MLLHNRYVADELCVDSAIDQPSSTKWNKHLPADHMLTYGSPRRPCLFASKPHPREVLAMVQNDETVGLRLAWACSLLVKVALVAGDRPAVPDKRTNESCHPS